VLVLVVHQALVEQVALQGRVEPREVVVLVD